MTTYLIKGLSRKAMEVFTFSDISAAIRADETRFKDYPTTIVSCEADLSVKPGPTLVNLFNGLIAEGEASVTRFTTRGDGARRIFDLLEQKYKHQPVEAEAAATMVSAAATTEEKEADVAKKKTSKKAKLPRVKKERVAKVKKPRVHKEKVQSSGGEKSKTIALELIGRKTGATPAEIAEKLEVSVGTAKNLIWYLRRDGKKIVLGEKSESGRRPYILD